MLGCCTGNPKTNAITIVAFSDLSTNVTVTLTPSASGTISMAVVGNDRSSAGPDGLTRVGYIGNVTISGLTPFTQYTYSATNGTDTATGSFYTAPLPNSKFAVSFTTCMNPGSKTLLGNKTAFGFLNWYRDNGRFPLIANVHVDDICYSDSASSFNNGSKSYDSTNGFQSEYNYSLHYAVLYGMTGSSSTATLTDSDVQEFLRNCNFLPQAGDHEYRNNIWSQSAILASVPNVLHATVGNYDGPARAAWNAFMKPLMGDSFAVANTNSHHWSCTLGDLQIIAPDCISNVAFSGSTITAGLGTDQISEILSEVNNTTPFKIIANPAFALTNDTMDSAYKVEQWIESERDALFLDSTSSLMQNIYTNGVYGVCAVMRGDVHGGPVFRFAGEASGSNLAEDYYEINLGGVNGGIGTPYFSASDFDNFTLRAGVTFEGGLAVHQESAACVVVEIDGSQSPSEMLITRYDWNHAGLPSQANLDTRFVTGDPTGPNNEWVKTFERKFIPYFGNEGFEPDAETWKHPQVSVSSNAL